MSDDLRTRIGKTLHRLYGPSLGAHPDGWDREPCGTQKMYLKDADAVIRELRLRRVTDVNRSVPQRRYVTEWEPDNA